MTAQASNKISINGEPHRLLSNPTPAFFEHVGHWPPFCATSTANWCGYISEWEIRSDTLFLVGLAGRVCRKEPEADGPKTLWCRVGHHGPCDDVPIRLGDLCQLPVGGLPATWFSGTLRVPHGAMVEYVHMGWGSRFERILIFGIEEGRVVSMLIKADERDGSEKQAGKSGLLHAAFRWLSRLSAK